MTVLFAIGTLNAFFLALLLSRQQANRFANRLLAGMLAIVGARLSIYVLGFGGIYDDHRWVTFAPLDLSAGIAPLLWCYSRTVTGAVPRLWHWHLIPMAVQFLYQAVCFVLPMPSKWTWYAGGHSDVVEPVAMMAILVAAAVYLIASWRAQARYQQWLDVHFSNRQPWRLTWLRAMLLAFAALLALISAMVIWRLAIEPVGYRARTPAMAGFCALAYLFGLLGWKHAGFDGPREAPVPETEPAPAERVDHAGRAGAWLARIETEGWWQEEGLSLGEVATRLAVSERSLSRALNSVGTNFNAAINRMRIAAIQRSMRKTGETRDLLTLALDHGFASKASFNRAFRDVTGATPSRWRRDIRQVPSLAQVEVIPDNKPR